MSPKASEEPVALVGLTGPAFISDWFESRWYVKPSKGTATIGTALLIGACRVDTEGNEYDWHGDLELRVERFAELAAARMARQQDQVLAIGMTSTAPARELGAKVLVPRRQGKDGQWTVEYPCVILASRSQAVKLQWLQGSRSGPEPHGILAAEEGNTALRELVVGLMDEPTDTSSVIQHLADPSAAKLFGGLQSLSVWAYKGGYEWGSLVVGRPGATAKDTWALLLNTANELGVTLYNCGDALDLLGRQMDDAEKEWWQPIPEHWKRLN